MSIKPNNLTKLLPLAALLLTTSLSCGGGGTHLPPVISVISPASTDDITGIIQVVGQVIPATEYTVTSVTCQMDSQPVLTPTGLEDWSIEIDTTHYLPGNHTFTIRAKDSGDLSTVLLFDMNIKPVPGGNINILNSLTSTSMTDYTNISDQLTDLEGVRFTYQSMNDSSEPVTVGGWMVKPPGDGPFPCILWLRGGIENNVHLAIIEIWAQYGYAVFASDYQGCGDYASGSPDMLGGEVYDCISLLAIAQSMPYVDLSNIFLWGNSRGTAVTVLTLDRLGLLGKAHEIKAAAVTATIYDIENAIEDGLNVQEEGVINYIMNLKGLSFDDAVAELFLRSPQTAYNHDDITTPLYIGHGELDIGYPPFHSIALNDDLTAQGVNVDLNIYPDVGHVLTTHPEIVTAIFTFWNTL